MTWRILEHMGRLLRLETALPNVAKWIAGILRFCAASAQKGGDLLGTPKTALVVSDEPLTAEEREDVLRRMQYYAPWMIDTMRFATRCAVSDILSTRPILFRGTSPRIYNIVRRIRANSFDIDPKTNHSEGWEWCRVNFEATRASVPSDSRERFLRYADRLEQLHLPKCYIFGTGPSLAQASTMDWSDGYRIVCNTIVRDADLWNRIRPHFIVAADTIYHFGFTAFARRFRADVEARLRETETYFVYPDVFHGLVSTEFSGLSDRLIPVPRGRHSSIHSSLREEFALPNLGNVLNLVLLPLACTFSKNVHLWGFDGRAPNDELFWANSSKHSYPELMGSLRAAHPAFFEHHVPADKPTKYVTAVHGDQLDRCLSAAERNGWSFVMMHKSWTATLQKRFPG